jgi:uncharacterized protein YfaS (alpha-2-macroglobulin family)
MSFTAIIPDIIQTIPEDDPEGIDYRLGLKSTLQIEFNQAVDRASFEEFFEIIPDGGAPLAMLGDYSWSRDDTRVTYRHNADLALDTRYTFGFAADSVYEKTGVEPFPETRIRFYTVGQPAIIATWPDDGGTVEPYTGFELTFATTMNPETLNDKIVIVPEPEREPDFFYSEWNDTLNVSFIPFPSTDYTITVLPGMEDIYGNAIARPFSFSYTTEQLPSSVTLVTPDDVVGFYSAYRQPTELFATHRNVSQLDLALYQIETADFASIMTGDWRYDTLYNTTPGMLVRTWQIPNVADTNRLRYERLNLSDFSGSAGSAQGVTCPGLPTRTKVGDRAVVITDPDPLRARAAVPDGEIVELLYRGYAFNIIGGPVCANNLTWYQIDLREGESAWVAEGSGDEYFFEVTNAAPQTAITVPEELLDAQSLPTGVYLLTANAPELAATGSDGDRQYMVVSTAVLTVKTALEQVTVWATDVQTGLPLANVPVDLWLYGEDLIYTASTDDDGLIYFEIPRREDVYAPVMAVLDDGVNFGIGYSEWTSGIEPFQYNISFDYNPVKYEFYLYTDRSVYRPGQTVYYRGVIRERSDVDLTRPESREVSVKINNNDGEAIYEGRATLTEFGTFSGEFTLAESAGVGYYQIEVVLDPDQPDPNFERRGSLGFDVAEYRLPEYQVTLASTEPAYADGDTMTFTVDTRYFFGGPVPDATVRYTVYTSDYFFTYEGQMRYDFADWGTFHEDAYWYDPYYGRFVSEAEGTTDRDGQLTVEIPAALDETGSQSLLVEASVIDNSGMYVSGRTTVVVHKSEVYAGVAAEKYVGAAGDETAFNIIAVDWDGQPVAGQTVDVEVFERRWSSVQRLDVTTGRIQYDSEVEEISVAVGSVTTDASGKATFSYTPPTGGTYVARVTTADAAGRTSVASTMQWVTDSAYVSWRADNNQRIEVITDRNSYEVGDVAEILITSPFTGTVQALVTVERGVVLYYERLTLDSNSLVYQLPISEDLAPNAFVNVILVKGVDDDNPVADFRMGIAPISIDRTRKELTINVEADREFAEPGEDVTFTLNVSDYQGDPVRAELGVSLVDLAALSIGYPYTQPIADFFYGPRYLGVRTSTGLTINTDYLTQYTLDVIKGGGGGGGGGGIFEIREQFVDTPYFNGALVTDASGEASFTVTLPDNLTTWQLSARAVTDGVGATTLVGETEYEFLSTKPVLVRPVTPRFFVVDDQVMLGAVVNNNTDEEVTAEVSLQAVGVTASSDLTQTVTIAANGSARVNWDVRVDDVTEVELIFFVDANDGAYTDATRPQVGQGANRTLPVYKYEAPETVGTGGMLRTADSRTEAIVLLPSLNVTQGELTVNLDTSLAATALESLEALENNRCNCTTVIAAKLRVNAAIKRALTLLGRDDPALVSQLDLQANIGLQRLAALQQVDGGWGWFRNDLSDPLVTTTAVLALVEASEAGYVVDTGILTAGVRYLDSALDAPRTDLSRDLNRQAFVVYALSRAGAPDNARMANLFEERGRLQLYSKALLWMALFGGDVNSTRLTTLRDEIFNAAIFSANGVHWEEERIDRFNWGSDTRTTALILKALMLREPDNDLAPNVVRWLMVARSADTWTTTEETTWALLGLTDWMLATAELNADYVYSAALNDSLLYEGTASPETVTNTQRLIVDVSDLLTDQANLLTVDRGAGDGALYYTAYLRAFLAVPDLPAVSRGITVQRTYLKDGQPVTSAQVGDLIEVSLTIIAPNDLNYAYVEDPLPAGVEGIDTGLATSQTSGTTPGVIIGRGDEDSPFVRGWGWWYFSNVDYLDEQVVLSTPYLPAGTYQFSYFVRPTVPGTYNVIPPTAREFYFPEVFGRGAGSTFTVTD